MSTNTIKNILETEAASLASRANGWVYVDASWMAFPCGVGEAAIYAPTNIITNKYLTIERGDMHTDITHGRTTIKLWVAS